MADEPKPQLKRINSVTLHIYCGYGEKGHLIKNRIIEMANKARRSVSDFVMNVLEGHKP